MRFYPLWVTKEAEGQFLLGENPINKFSCSENLDVLFRSALHLEINVFLLSINKFRRCTEQSRSGLEKTVIAGEFQESFPPAPCPPAILIVGRVTSNDHT